MTRDEIPRRAAASVELGRLDHEHGHGWSPIARPASTRVDVRATLVIRSAHRNAPASRIGDNHVRPMVNPGPTPHVGGPILTGLGTVLIGNKHPPRASATRRSARRAARLDRDGRPTCSSATRWLPVSATPRPRRRRGAGPPHRAHRDAPAGMPCHCAAAKSGVAFCEEPRPPPGRGAREEDAVKKPARRPSAQQGHQQSLLGAAAKRSAAPVAGARSIRRPARWRAPLDPRAGAFAGRCLRSVREAIEAGGASPGRTLSAKGLPNLERAGASAAWRPTGRLAGARARGREESAPSRHRHGHIAMYDGGQGCRTTRQQVYATRPTAGGQWTVYRL